MFARDQIVVLSTYLDAAQRRLNALNVTDRQPLDPTADGAAREMRRAAEVVGRAQAYVGTARRTVADVATDLETSPGVAAHDLGLFVRQVDLAHEFTTAADRHLAAMRRTLEPDTEATNQLRELAADRGHLEDVSSILRAAARLGRDLAEDLSRSPALLHGPGLTHERRAPVRPALVAFPGPPR